MYPDNKKEKKDEIFCCWLTENCAVAAKYLVRLMLRLTTNYFWPTIGFVAVTSSFIYVISDQGHL